jgi:hypothetical protein
MSSPSNAENITTANQGAHLVIAEEGDGNGVNDTALPPGTPRELTTSYSVEREALGGLGGMENVELPRADAMQQTVNRQNLTK